MGRGYYLSRTTSSVVRNTKGNLSQRHSLPKNRLSADFIKVDPTQDVPLLEERLPTHYMEFYRQWKKGPSPGIHDELRTEKYEKNEHGVVIPVQNVRIPVLYPEEFHKGLWGGEGVVRGLLEREPTRHKPDYKPPTETYWWPRLHIGVVFSEVLNKHIKVTMTKRAQNLIDENYGLDYYLLKTPVNEIYSHVGLKLKREILLALVRNTEMIPSEIYLKYEPYKLPEEVALWHGLPWKEAVHRLFTLDRIVEEEESMKPLKKEYRAQLYQLLQQGYLDDVDANVLYEDETPKSDLPGILGKGADFLKKRGNFIPSRK